MKESKQSLKNESMEDNSFACPNCWGVQEYEGEYQANDQEKIDLKNIDLKKGWIEGYVAKKLLV